MLFGRPLRSSRLTIRVHVDAFVLEPLGYMQAVFWRVCGLKLRSRNRLAALMGRSPNAYRLWIEKIEPVLQAGLLEVASEALVSIIPVVDASASGGSLGDTIDSITNAGGSIPVIVGGEAQPGVRHVRRPSDLAQLVSSSGSWLCIVSGGDLLAPQALNIYGKLAASAETATIIYSDDDLSEGGKRHSPHFKSHWNPDLYAHHDFITGSAILRVTPDMLTGLSGDDWATHLVQSAIAKGGTPHHLPAVLHHRRHRPAPIIPDKVAPVFEQSAPSVAVIVPPRNHLSYLRKCIEGVRSCPHPAVELIVVDNGSDDPETLDYLSRLESEGAQILRVAGDFNFSALNNLAAKHAQADLLCFLNNDVEIVDRDWLSWLVRQAVRPEVGAVGGRLLYPDGTVQHAGVVIGVGGGAAHAHKNVGGSDEGYFLRDRLPQRVTAVTAACLAVTKEKFLAVGGFDEVDFPVAFNDVDLCLKLNARGWQSFYEPRAILVHHESKSRGSDRSKRNRARFAGELAALKRRWATDRKRDPYHHPNLSPFCEQFTISV